jgi:hypothetical protein
MSAYLMPIKLCETPVEIDLIYMNQDLHFPASYTHLFTKGDAYVQW